MRKVKEWMESQNFDPGGLDELRDERREREGAIREDS